MAKTNHRQGWDEYFMDLAHIAATRSTCDRGVKIKFLPNRCGVGAVIVRDRVILSTGYNGSVRGAEHCDEAGHMMEDGHCVRTVHAEANAIIQAAKNGTAVDGATIYSTASPCWNCFKLIVNAGIKRAVFEKFYRDERVMKLAGEISFELVELTKQKK